MNDWPATFRSTVEVFSNEEWEADAVTAILSAAGFQLMKDGWGVEVRMILASDAPDLKAVADG